MNLEHHKQQQVDICNILLLRHHNKLVLDCIETCEKLILCVNHKRSCCTLVSPELLLETEIDSIKGFVVSVVLTMYFSSTIFGKSDLVLIRLILKCCAFHDPFTIILL